MEVTTYTQARKNFAKAMDRVCDDHVPLVVTRQNQRPVVIISLEDYNSMEETMYLLGTGENRDRLIASVKRISEGKAFPVDLIDEE